MSKQATFGHDISTFEDEIPCCIVAKDGSNESMLNPEPTLEDAVLEAITLQ
jgi:hypothetical protein